MNATSRPTLMAAAALLLAAGLAQAAQPPDSVKSDSSLNTAMGSNAQLELTTGIYNTAAGAYSLYANQTGSYNTAFGVAALFEDAGGNNTAIGAFALEVNGTGGGNTAVGYEALGSNSNGGDNTAVGQQALFNNTGGLFNVAIGQGALQANISGSSNTAIGETALMSATGGGNIAIGEKAGELLGAGNNNVYIANSGQPSESGAIRIGESFQTATYISGIYTTQVTGSAVYVTSSGQLGVLASSERFKTDVAPMGRATSHLQQLRPVTFELKTDASRTRQYGLIAEEVDKIYPELVIRDSGGKIQGVRYEELAPMLLNEVQQQRRDVDQLKQRLSRQAQQLAELRQQNESIQKLLASVMAKGPALAMR
jgi:Chaperone of endosialidase